MQVEPLHIAIIAAGLVVGLALIWRRRKAIPRGLEPESRFMVRISDTEVACERPDGKTERVGWNDLQRVEIRTTSDGPMAPDVFWLLHGTNGGCAIPQGATGERALLERLQALPGFDNGQVIEAMGSTSDRTFLCWQRPVRCSQ
jgi:hypothetical protein